MLRLEITLQRPLVFRHWDRFHDAMVASLIRSGLKAEQVIGHEAESWTFGPKAFDYGNQAYRVRKFQVSSLGDETSRAFVRMDWGHLQENVESETDLTFDIKDVKVEQPPFENVSMAVDATLKMLSPLVIGKKGGKWQNPATEGFDLSAALSSALSRHVKRPVALEAEFDPIYRLAHANINRAVLFKHNKGNPQKIYGTVCPILVRGSSKDLRAAWYAGLGAKTRCGFGNIEVVS